MSKKHPKKTNETDKPSKLVDELQIHINEFGEIITNLEIEKINQFLNKNVDDKKLRKS